MNKSLTVIIVVYHPSLQQASRIDNLDFIHKIVIDNTPKRNNKSLFSDSVDYIPLNENMGIGFAQNVGIKRAEELGYKHIIFFDQDSCVDKTLVENLYQSYCDLYNSDPRIGVLGPRIVNKRTHELYKSHCLSNDGYTIVPTLISSGSITRLSVIKDVGLFDESLFIDYVDHEWCWRCRKFGYHCIISSNISMLHSVGKRSVSIFGLDFIESASFRYFYQYRNFLLLLRRDYVPIKWKIRTTVRNMVGLLVYPIISSEHKKALVNIMDGIKCGLKITKK
jgi:rhamnosyltransferase